MRKRQTRLAGLDERVLDLYSGGMSVSDIAAHLSGLYGVEIGRDTISRVTDAVLENVERRRKLPSPDRTATRRTRSSRRARRPLPSSSRWLRNVPASGRSSKANPRSGQAIRLTEQALRN